MDLIHDGNTYNTVTLRWAVVTGCTGGIGRAYVLELAARGMDIVLVIICMKDDFRLNLILAHFYQALCSFVRLTGRSKHGEASSS